MMEFQKEVDARGLNCPLPILKAKKALTDMKSGDVLRVPLAAAGGRGAGAPAAGAAQTRPSAARAPAGHSLAAHDDVDEDDSPSDGEFVC